MCVSVVCDWTISVVLNLKLLSRQKIFSETAVISAPSNWTQQSHSEANSSSASQEIPSILWNPKIQYCIHNSPPLSQVNAVLASPSPILKIHFNIILPYMARSSEWSISLKFPHQNPVYTSLLLHTCYMPNPFHSSCFDHPNSKGCGIQFITLLIV